MKRDRWLNKSTFIMAAIGSAVGLGNAWRFPNIAYSNGGGAFLIPYIVAVITAGIPLLAMEIAIGKKYQCGAPMAFRKMGKGMQWIGWLGVATAFVISTYYSVIVGWVLEFMGMSFTAPWNGADLDAATSIFYNDVLKISGGLFDLGGFSWTVLIGLTLGWFLIWYSIRNGVKSVGKLVKYTVILPVIILVIIIIRGVTLPGAMEGISYLVTPQWDKLLDTSVWAAAYGQVFFSMSILFTIMIAYGSYLPKETDVPKSTLIIGLADAGISFMAGFAAFSILGYIANLTGGSITDVPVSGPGLTFITYPIALGAMPGGDWMVILFSLLFFIMLFTLAIDSAFSIVEAVITSVVDKFKLDKKKTTLWGCVFGYACSLIFATRAGLYWLDIIDHFINDFNLIFIGLAECIAIGWIFGGKKMLAIINENADKKFGAWWIACIKYVCPVIFLFISITFLIDNLTANYGGYGNTEIFIAGWLFVIATFVFGFVMTFVKDRKGSQEEVIEAQTEVAEDK